MFKLFHHAIIDQFLNLLIKTNHHFDHQMRCRDQSPFITHIILYFSFIHLKIPYFSLKFSFDVAIIKHFQDKIRIILFFHRFHKVYLNVLFQS